MYCLHLYLYYMQVCCLSLHVNFNCNSFLSIIYSSLSILKRRSRYSLQVEYWYWPILCWRAVEHLSSNQSISVWYTSVFYIVLFNMVASILYLFSVHYLLLYLECQSVKFFIMYYFWELVQLFMLLTLLLSSKIHLITTFI